MQPKVLLLSQRPHCESHLLSLQMTRLHPEWEGRRALQEDRTGLCVSV